MSKVAITGNASGTGTLTIAAPNTNTDRTLTLPDEAGTVLTTTSGVAKTGDTMTGNLTVDGSVVVNGATTNSNANWGYYINPKSGGAVGDFTLTDPTGNFGRLNIDGSGRVTMPYQPAFNAYISSATNIASSWQEVVYNNICYNNGSHYNTSNGRFTAPVSGYYFFSYALTFTSADGDGTIGVFINSSYDGTSSVSQISQPTTGAPHHGRGGSGLIYLSAGDYASVWNYNTDTRQTRSGNPRGGFIAGYLVG